MTPVHPGERSSSILHLFSPWNWFFSSISWEFLLIRCEVKGQGCGMCTYCKALWGTLIICDICCIKQTEFNIAPYCEAGSTNTDSAAELWLVYSLSICADSTLSAVLWIWTASLCRALITWSAQRPQNWDPVHELLLLLLLLLFWRQ